jgi:23S rRNA (cytidine1920-2'-O)/16S rRNA (cytidine1409-2'-O)-methyltransferase
MTSNNRKRLDLRLVSDGLVSSRSQAESYIKLNLVSIDGMLINKAGYLTAPSQEVKILQTVQYVNRAALKLESIAQEFKISFFATRVLDVGSSTGGFTDYALKQGASNIFAVELGSEQLHPTLRGNPKVELYEKTDILNVQPFGSKSSGINLSFIPDYVVIDLSFISLREILPHIAELVSSSSQVIAMVKPQFEASFSGLKHKGVIKNENIRRQILREFEVWLRDYYYVVNKADSKVAGAKGNLERFYLLKKLS